MKAQNLQRSKKSKTMTAKKNNIKQHSLQHKADKMSKEVKSGKSANMVEGTEMPNDMSAAKRKREYWWRDGAKNKSP